MAPRAVAPALVLVLLAAAGTPAAAGASTIAGHVGGAKLPAAGKGVASVRAVNAKTLVVTAAAKVRAGRYSLKVPAGGYLLFAATTPFRGKAGVDVSAGAVAIRAGKRKTLRVSLRKPKAKKKTKLPKLKIPKFKIPTLATARAAFVPVKYPAVWIQRFKVDGPAEFNVLRRGIVQMLTTDVLPPLEAACGGAVVERERLNDVLAEHALQQSGAVDPATAVQPGRMIAHNREVSGTYTVTGATSTLTATVTNVVTGKTRSVTRSAATDRFFELVPSIVPELVRLICGGRPPAFYAGSLSGETSVSSSGSSQKLTWTGDVRLKLSDHDLQPATGDDPPGEYALYEPASGNVQVKIDGNDGECTYHGEASIGLVRHPGEFSRVQMDVDEPAYYLIASLPEGVTMPVVTSGPAYCGGGQTSPFGLGGRVVLGSQDTQRSASTQLTGSASVPVGNVSNRWAWSLGPQA